MAKKRVTAEETPVVENITEEVPVSSEMEAVVETFSAEISEPAIIAVTLKNGNVVSLREAVIEEMANGPIEKRIVCPVCGGEKLSRAWICAPCFDKRGHEGLKFIVEAEVKRRSLFEQAVTVCSRFVADQAPVRPTEHQFLEMVKDARPDIPAHFWTAGLKKAKEIIEAEAAAAKEKADEEAARVARETAERDEHKRQLDITSAVISELYPNGQRPEFQIVQAELTKRGERIADRVVKNEINVAIARKSRERFASYLAT